ncbi:hypothetical protein Tco_0857668 [Tanacetum coccineum]|uniref:Uncharacterized protein n=1 Tax=Tanacetum coccineum TaxID=301880 RepID=A0ABQ5B6V9_9ASTR
MALSGSSSGISRHALNELMDLSGEAEDMHKAQSLMGNNSLECMRESQQMENNKLKALTNQIIQTKDVIRRKEGRMDIMDLCLIFYFMDTFEILDQLTKVADSSRLQNRMKRSCKHWESGDTVRCLDHMRDIVARDSAKLGVLEQLLAGTHVGVGPKDSYVADMKEKE